MTMSRCAIVLDERGGRVVLGATCQEQKCAEIDYLVNELGFVLLVMVRGVLFVELSPLKVRPLAALEAFYEINDKRWASCSVVISLAGDSWRSSKYEFITSAHKAAKRMSELARASRRRAAAALASRGMSRTVSGEAAMQPPGQQSDELHMVSSVAAI